MDKNTDNMLRRKDNKFRPTSLSDCLTMLIFVQLIQTLPHPGDTRYNPRNPELLIE